jgi:hypothetical protein
MLAKSPSKAHVLKINGKTLYRSRGSPERTSANNEYRYLGPLELLGLAQPDNKHRPGVGLDNALMNLVR